MKRNGRFWWFVTMIALAHLGAILLVSRWALAAREPQPQSITWLSGGGAPARNESDDSPATSSATTMAAVVSPAAAESPVSLTKSEIQLPTATPAPAATPSASRKPDRSPTPRPTSTPRTRASPSPNRKSSPASKKSPSPPAKGKGAKLGGKSTPAVVSHKSAGQDKGAGDSSGAGTGTAAKAAEFGWYGNMLHDRFYKEWVQPTTVVASGAKFSARARIRIEKDGTVSDFKVSQPSGNVLVDESVAAAGGRVKKVDAVPAALLRGEHYDIEVVFALNPK
ncbi:MAG: TonB C-terminal domain-containing protein [Verrucomicrobiota bacterium]